MPISYPPGVHEYIYENQFPMKCRDSLMCRMFLLADEIRG